MVIRPVRFFPLLALAAAALLFGLWAGLLRLGWRLPIPQVAAEHGPLMVSGFLGTLISLERVAALRKPWMFAAPLFSGLGWVAGLVLPWTALGPLLITFGSLVFVGILAVMLRREPKIFILSMAVGVVSWLVGNLFWLAGVPIFRLVLWWAAFLVLTIAGERLELSRVLRLGPRQMRLFLAAALIFLFGVILSTWFADLGARLAGLGMVALALWLVRFDIARRNLRHPAPLTRYIAICLFAGYIWLLASGVLTLFYGAQQAGAIYDALLHTVFVGFVFSMIFGHAPIILPALTGLPVVFRPVFYVHLVLLHASLVLRVAGDLLGQAGARRWGGLLNEVAVLLFLAVTIFTVARSRRKIA